MRVTTNFILFLFITISLLFSCNGNNHSLELLDQAQDLIESNPEHALMILDSIDNPRGMGTDKYMQYIVTYVGAKHEMKADILEDTLIFDAQKYFNNKRDFKNSPYANYYAGWVYYTNDQLMHSLESFMQVVSNITSQNSLLVGRSLNNIGYIYYQQQLYDSAIINYQKALVYYSKIENTEERKLRTFTYLGSAYEALNKLDSASYYFNKCLSLSRETDNKAYQFYSLKNLGVVCYGEKKFNKAIEYFQSALAVDVEHEEEVRQVYLYLLNIYNKKQELSLAKQYADLVITSLPQVTYNYTTKEMYGALADYYQELGDYKKSLEYRNLEMGTKEQIQREADAVALLAADKKFHLTQKDQEVKQARSHAYLFLMIGVAVLGIVLSFLFFIWKDNKKGKAEIREYAAKYDEIKMLLLGMGEKYPKIEAEIKSILEAD